MKGEWSVGLHLDFVPEFDVLPKAVQDELMAHMAILRFRGPLLGRPNVDTLKGSRHANMKELRFNTADGVWRFAFAFDPRRMAVVLCGGDKVGGNEARFYRQLIAVADSRFDMHAFELGRVSAIKNGA